MAPGEQLRELWEMVQELRVMADVLDRAEAWQHAAHVPAGLLDLSARMERTLIALQEAIGTSGEPPQV